MTHDEIVQLLGQDASNLLEHQCQKIPKKRILKPGPKHVDTVFTHSDRPKKVINNLKKLYNHGRLAKTGYLSILPVDQGVEHTAASSFYLNPDYFDPDNIVKLAIEGGCSGVASTLGVLGLISKKYSAKIPFIVKLNHNELLTYPTKYDQTMFAQVEQAANMGALGVGATIYFGSKQSSRQIVEVGKAFAKAHELGLFAILWCYPRNDDWQKDNENYEQSVDLTAQAIHIGATLEADIIKQKMPNSLAGFATYKFGKFDTQAYEALVTAHPIDLVRYQVLHAYAGKISLLNSGGASSKSKNNDLEQAVLQAVINKRGGGAGLIMGRKAFSKPLKEGVQILHAVQDVYLDKEITLA
jgi:class I fructose-bisphosphate aldolase